MKAAAIVCIVGLVSRVLCAPVGTAIDKKSGRVSTKEILDLEQQLKVQAGEDKKFFPSQMQHLMPKQHQLQVPQVDGLEDHQDPQGQSKDPGSGEAAAGPADRPPSRRSGPDSAAVDDFDVADDNGGKDVARRREEEPLAILEGRGADGDEAELLDAAANTFTGDIRKEAMRSAGGGQADSSHQSDGVDDEEEAELEGQREDDEALFMQSVADVLKERPDLLKQFLEDENLRNPEAADAVPTDEDEADRDDVIKAELLEATGRQEWKNTDPLVDQYQLGKTGLIAPLLDDVNTIDPAVRRADNSHLIPLDLDGLESIQELYGDETARQVAKKGGYSLLGVRPHLDSDSDSDKLLESESGSVGAGHRYYIPGREGDSDEGEEKGQDKPFEDDLAALNAYRAAVSEKKRVDMARHLAM